MSKIRTRRLRRTMKQARKHGLAAKRRHKKVGGRTGNVAKKRRGGLAWEAKIRATKETK